MKYEEIHSEIKSDALVFSSFRPFCQIPDQRTNTLNSSIQGQEYRRLQKGGLER